MNLYRVVPPPPEVYDLSAESSRQAIEQLYQPEGSSSVRAIMVTNSAGDTIGPQGSSQDLSQGADRALLSILRENSDAVIVGASTIRREPVPLPRTTPLVVLCSSGDLNNHQLVSRGGRDEHLIVVAPAQHRGALGQALGGFPWEHLSWESDGAVEDLLAEIQTRTSGGHVLVEGGRITWEFFAPLTTELLIATIPPPRDHHQGIPPWWPGDPSHWTLRSLLTDDQKMLYYRHEIAPAARPSL